MTSLTSKDTSVTSQVSQTAATQDEGSSTSTSTYCCLSARRERRPFLDGNREAIGWLLVAIGAAISIAGSGAFLSTTILNLALEAAGCATEPPPGESTIPDCNNTVYGMKPSSIISTFATVVGLVAAFLSPLLGAILDTTAYRRAMGRFVSVFFCAAFFPTIFINRDNWFAMTFCLALIFFSILMGSMVMNAYLPELARDEMTLSRYSKVFTAFPVIATVLFVLAISLISSVLYDESDDDDESSGNTNVDNEISTARLAQSVNFALAAGLYFVAWTFLFQPRPPARTLGETESVWTSGFIQLYRTTRKVHKDYPATRWFFVATALGDAGTNSLLVLVVTYLTDQLEFSSTQNGMAVIILLLSMAPGAYVSSLFIKWYNPVLACIWALVLVIVNTSVASLVLTGPEQEIIAYILSVVWGISIGFKYTSDRPLFATIMPPGQNTEFAGALNFFSNCLLWLPPLLFTILNQSDVSMRWGLASLNIFLVLSVLVYHFGVGSYVAAVDTARGTDAQAGDPNDVA